MNATAAIRNCRLLGTLLTACLFLSGCRVKATQPAHTPEPAAVIRVESGADPTPTITPAPTPAPAAEITFVENAANPLPNDNTLLRPGETLTVFGRVSSAYPLTAVTVRVACTDGDAEQAPVERTAAFDPSGAVYACMLNNLTGGDTDGTSDSEPIGALSPGYYDLTVSAASTAQSEPVELVRTGFFVLGSDWLRLRPADLGETYEATNAFFGGRAERFLYPYQRVKDYAIAADPDWEDAYIVSLDMVGERKWRVHVDTVPYYEKALAYLKSTFVRVHGTNGDSGALVLTKLIESYDGSYQPRFITGKQSLSHHSFGTATDLNAGMVPNQNKDVNLGLIDREVRDRLTYDGVAQTGGKRCYSFTYAGEYHNADCGIPQTVVNYLLYELAFYRAGFQWGHYYDTKSDAMHFTLTDRLAGRHDAAGGLRKVFDYAD